MPTRFSGSAAEMVTVSPASRQVAHRAQRLHRFRQRELLAQESADEPSAAHFAAIFQPPKGDQQLAPLGQIRFARQHLAKDHAIAPQQHPASCFGHACCDRSFRRDRAATSAPAYVAAATLCPSPGPSRRLGLISERRLSKPSAVTIPAATNSHSAVSISAFSLPVPRTMSAKNDAPRRRKNSSTARALSLSTRSKLCSSSPGVAASSRTLRGQRR